MREGEKTEIDIQLYKRQRKRKNNKQKIKEEVDHKQAFHLIISYVLNLHPWFLTYPSLNLPSFI